jgi:hypothetical protein
MDIPAASVSQILHLKDGRVCEIEDDVSSVVKDLQEIDRGFRVRYSEATELFVLYHVDENGVESLVRTTPVLDKRLVNRIREIAAPGYDYAGELERLDREAKKRQDDEHAEKMGDLHERLAHAIRTDLKKAEPGGVYVPPDVY